MGLIARALRSRRRAEKAALLPPAGQREKLLTTTDRLEKTTDRLRQGKQQLLETEEVGVTILQNLHQQRETITHAHGTLNNADANIGKSRQVRELVSFGCA